MLIQVQNLLNVLFWLLLTRRPDWEFISPDSEVLSFHEGLLSAKFAAEPN